MTIDWSSEKEEGKGFYDSPFEENKERASPLGFNYFKKIEEQETQKVEKFEDEVKHNPLLKRHDIKTVRGKDLDRTKKKLDFWKSFGVICFLALVIFLSIFCYMIYQGKLTPAIIDNSNDTINVDTPDVPITNNYENKFQNNFSLNMNLGDEFADLIAEDVVNAVKDKLNKSNITIN